MVVYLYRLMSLLSCKARITAVTKGAISLLGNAHNFRSFIKLSEISVRKSTSHLPSGALWNNFTFQSIESPSKSLHLLHKSPGSTPHRDSPHYTFTQPGHRPCASPCLSCQSVPGSSTSPCPLCPARWLQCSRDQSAQACSMLFCKPSCPAKTQGTTDCYDASQGWGERQGSLKQGYWDILSPLPFSRLYFAQSGVQAAALESQRKPVNPPPTLSGPFSGLDVEVGHLHRNPQ